MSSPRGLGFGGFLVGLGVGWFIFTNYDVTSNLVSWILIIVGGSIVLSSLISLTRPGLRLSGLVSNFSVGLIIALIVTSGFTVFFPWNVQSLVYRSSQEESRFLAGDITASNVLFRTDNVNGYVRVSTWEREEYSVDLTVKGRGSSDSDASRTIEQVDTSLEEQLVGGRQELDLVISVPTNLWSRITVNVEVKLPADAEIDLDVETTNGEISAINLEGGTLRLDTTNGRIVFDGVEAEVIDSSTTNGVISGVVEAADFTGSTTNGKIELEIPCTVSGDYDLHTTNGGVEVTVVASEDVGFEVDMRTTIGGVSLNLPNLNYSTNTNRRKVAETTGFSTKPIQVSITAGVTTGSCSLGT
ncbi:MAG: DUF4097 family beta strand repeat protein [Candidatus Bathyarchaeota archaeon]|nr:MAG: DUF4097 family beta strand repeat protein [Candidatus Bathyarchaeota archaeon]